MRRLVAPLCLALLGCDPGVEGKPYHYPLDRTLRLHHLQAKGTHNSYHVAMPGAIEPWRYTHAPLDEQLDRQGVRQIELDVNYEADVDRFEVYHVVLADQATTCRLLVDCLRLVKGWSNRFPGHLPLYIQIEPKSGFRPERAEHLFALLESEILAVWPPERLITPASIQGSAPDLRTALSTAGWPVLAELRGKALFAFDNTGAVRTAYTHGDHDLDGRLLFVDSAPGDPFAAVAVRNDPIADADAIRAALAANLLVRTRADSDSVEPLAGDRTRAEAALASGAHFISTDYPMRMGSLDYVFDVPGGTPSRCNPITAPADCVPTAVEDPAFVGSQGP